MYETTDQNLTCALWTCGHKFSTHVELRNGRKVVVFAFEDDVEDEAQSFLSGQLKLEARQLLMNLRTIKSQIYDLTKNT